MRPSLGVRAVEGSNPFAPKFRKPGSLSPGLFEFMEADERFEGSTCGQSCRVSDLQVRVAVPIHDKGVNENWDCTDFQLKLMENQAT